MNTLRVFVKSKVAFMGQKLVVSRKPIKGTLDHTFKLNLLGLEETDVFDPTNTSRFAICFTSARLAYEQLKKLGLKPDKTPVVVADATDLIDAALENDMDIRVDLGEPHSVTFSKQDLLKMSWIANDSNSNGLFSDSRAKFLKDHAGEFPETIFGERLTGLLDENGESVASLLGKDSNFYSHPFGLLNPLTVTRPEDSRFSKTPGAFAPHGSAPTRLLGGPKADPSGGDFKKAQTEARAAIMALFKEARPREGGENFTSLPELVEASRLVFRDYLVIAPGLELSPLWPPHALGVKKGLALVWRLFFGLAGSLHVMLFERNKFEQSLFFMETLLKLSGPDGWDAPPISPDVILKAFEAPRPDLGVSLSVLQNERKLLIREFTLPDNPPSPKA
ncbi:MAG: hypothetical protein LBO66_01065 [Deltaproteobacteria bacterium]|nr:hypothetical protein [Deltaproteobacteria bacterium]